MFLSLRNRLSTDVQPYKSNLITCRAKISLHDTRESIIKFDKYGAIVH